MTTSAASPTARATVDARSGPADVFVAFGITGDLAKVMTFMSLYRLEFTQQDGIPWVTS